MIDNFFEYAKVKKIQYDAKQNKIKMYLIAKKIDIISLLNKISHSNEILKTYLNDNKMEGVNFDIYEDLFIEFEEEISSEEKAELLYEYICIKILEQTNSKMYAKRFIISFSEDELNIKSSSESIERVILLFFKKNKSFLSRLGFSFSKIESLVDSKFFKSKKLLKISNAIKKTISLPTTSLLESSTIQESSLSKAYPKSRSYSKKFDLNEYSELSDEDINAKISFNKKKFMGKIFNVEEKKYSSGKGKLFIIAIYNELMNRAINVIKFSSNPEEELEFKEGQYIIVYGSYKKDEYSKDVISFQMISDYIEKSEQPLLKDDLIVKDDHFRHEFHLHTSMSVMDAVGTPKSFLEEANKKNIKSIAITDHNSTQAFPQAYLASKKFPNIKINYGVEFDVIDDINVKIVRNDRDQKLLNSEFVFFDIEATGLSSFVNEMIEFGAVKYLSNANLVKEQFFVRPTKLIPEHITELTNIKQSDVEDGLNEYEALLRIKKFIGNSILVAHNADYDIGFINNLLIKNNLEIITNPVIDTLKLSWLINSDSNKHRLGALAKKYNIEYDEEGSHRADYDAKVLMNVFHFMVIELKEKFSIDNLNQINEHTSKIYKKMFSKHINVLAKNQDGLKDLFKLVSIQHIETFNEEKGLPILYLSQLVEMKKNKNILIGSSCSNGFLWEEINNGLSKDFFINLYDYYEIFPPSSYKSLVVNNYFTEEELQNIINEIILLGNKNNKLVIVSGNVHYPSKADHLSRSVYILNKGLGGRRHPLFSFKNPKNLDFPEAHLKSYLELKGEFSFLEEKISNEILLINPEKLDKMLEPIIPVKDKLYPPIIENSREEFLKILNTNLLNKYGKTPNEIIKNRIDKELNSIIGNGYDIIYYLSSLAVRKSLKDGYLVGSRGSVGSSLVATLTDITEVNPLPAHYYCQKCKTVEFAENHSSGFDLEQKNCKICNSPLFGDGNDIPFETFLGFNGDKVPDIDLNFSGEYQIKIHDYIKEILSEEKVFRAGTISTVAQRTAFGYVKNFLEIIEDTSFQKSDISYLSSIVEGTKRTTGQHPGGLIVVPQDKEIYDFTPINFPGNDINSSWKTTHFDFHSIHDNLLKLDFLGHLDPTVLRMLFLTTNVNPKDVPLNDKEVLKLFESTEPLKILDSTLFNESLGILGIPEFGTSFVRELVKDATPKTFADLIRISGLSHGTDVWLGNAKDLIVNNIASLKEVISVRDDIMTFLIRKGLNSTDAFQIMESVRKGNGLKPEWEIKMKQFNVPDWYIESCKKIKYMFPKAHATAYVIMAFRIAWYKINFPLEYYASFFTKRDVEFSWDYIFELDKLGNSVPKPNDKILEGFKYLKSKVDKTDKEVIIIQTLEILLEMLARGYNLSSIDLNISEAFDWKVDKENNKIIPPFIIIDGLGDNAAKKLQQNREEIPFTNYDDFVARSGLNKTQFQFFQDKGLLNSLHKEIKEEVIDNKQKSFDF